MVWMENRNRLPLPLEYILTNENLNIDSFMTKSDIKTSTKKEVVFSRLNSGAFVDGEYEELQTSFDNAKDAREFERNLSPREKRQFKKLWGEEQVSALKYAIPAHVYDKMKEGQWDGVMESYRIYDPDDLDDFLEEHGEAFGRMKLNEKLGMYKVGSREDAKELQQLFQNDGTLIPYSSMEESGGALEAYLDRLSKYEDKGLWLKQGCLVDKEIIPTWTDTSADFSTQFGSNYARCEGCLSK